MKIIAIIFTLVLAGCSSVSVQRDPAGTLDVSYRALFTDVQAPSLDVEKIGDYKAKFNADGIERSLTAEEVAALLKVLGIAR